MSASTAKRATERNVYTFPIVIEQDDDGWFVNVPTLQGCYTSGETYEEAMRNIADAIKLHVTDRLENGEPIPAPTSVSVSMMQVAA